MKLLRFPYPYHNGTITAIACLYYYDDNSDENNHNNKDFLFTCGGDNKILIWDVQELIDTTIGKNQSIPQPIEEVLYPEIKDSDGISPTAPFKLQFTSMQNKSLFMAFDSQTYVLVNYSPNNATTNTSNTNNKIISLFEPKTVTVIDIGCIGGYGFVLLQQLYKNENDTKVGIDTTAGMYLVRVFNSDGKYIFDIPLMENTDRKIAPVTLIPDPTEQFLVIYNNNKSVFVIQYDIKLKTFKKLYRLPQYTNVEPIHYKIDMPPQGNFIPLANVVNSTKQPTISLVDMPGAPLAHNTTNGIIPAIQTKQSQFKTIVSLVGQSEPDCNIIKFSPRVYCKHSKKTKEVFHYNLLATATTNSDNIVVWNTKRKKPLFNAAQISNSPDGGNNNTTSKDFTNKKNISDICWSSDGKTLIVTSFNGFISIFSFKIEELGDIMTFQDMEKLKLLKLPPLSPPVIDKNMESTTVQGTVKNKKTSTVIKGKDSQDVAINLPTKEPQKIISSNIMKFTLPSSAVPKDLKRVKSSANHTTHSAAKKVKKELKELDFIDTSLLLPLVAFSKIRLAIPKVRLKFSYSTKNYKISVINGNSTEAIPTKLILDSLKTNNGITTDDNVLEKPIFTSTHYLPKLINLCTGTEYFWAIATEQGQIHIHSVAGGSHLVPPIILGVPVSFLESCGVYLMCITSIGQLYCWDIAKLKLKFPMCDIYPLLSPTLRYSDEILSRAENLTSCSISSNGVPIITTSNGDGYMYDCDMQNWLLVSDSWWAYGSQYWDLTNTINGDSSVVSTVQREQNNDNKGSYRDELGTNTPTSSIVSYLESRTNDELYRRGSVKLIQKFAKTMLMKEGFENLEEIVSLAHLENRILCCLKLKMYSEFEHLLITYCVRLAEMDYADRLNEVFQFLYGDDGQDSNLCEDIGADSANVKLKTKHQLLHSVLVACTSIRQVQRLTLSYFTALENSNL
ncbi:Hir2p SCDLUD_003180 [Saccharomycodes ludwigii]|uniref:Hir2p n=1 Tax=Saccharomycodes ludwigii TaxID=36035 RepID=UPI001E85DECA|nr:hypothetical protein SCDLUD_003180 [Saccharomycodes ludwigii]KAH3900209.1 hypothetical protein SCDLUD_003180 [Saccharomycodes ludwigii]